MNSKQELLDVISRSDHTRHSDLYALFKYVPDLIVKQMSYKKYKKDEYLIHAKTPCDTIYIILSGKVAGLDFQKQGRAYYFMDFTQMPIVGDFEVFGEIPDYTVSIRATEDSAVLLLPSSYYLQWIQNDENALYIRIKNIISTLTLENKSEREYLFMNCRERLVKYMVNSYENGHSGHSGSYKLNKTQLELSDRIGFNIRSVQRGIAALEKENLISLENGKITISQEQFLRLKQIENEV